MKIGIDVHAAEKDGSGNCTYMRNLLLGLASLDEENIYFLYATNPGHPFYEQVKHKNNFCLRHLKPENPLLRIPFSLAYKTFTDRLDILHVQYIAPFVFTGKLVVTIHDLAIRHLPESFNRFELLRSRFLFPLNARRADRIITGSEFSKKDIETQFGIEPQKIECIHIGISPHFKPIKDPAGTNDLLERYGIHGRYVFSLGRLNLRKNIESVITAVELLRKKLGHPIGLVIGGQKDVLAQGVIEKIRLSDIKDDIVVTGFIPEDELPYFFSAAEAFVYPSFFEGFGLPPLEAMACGCPVVTSDVSSIPEIVGDAAILINPEKPDELTRAIYRVLSDERFRESIIRKGLERASSFDREGAARRTLDLYRRVCEA